MIKMPKTQDSSLSISVYLEVKGRHLIFLFRI